jgi:hypothetical protein
MGTYLSKQGKEKKKVRETSEDKSVELLAMLI